jgi:hypothetical protein
MNRLTREQRIALVTSIRDVAVEIIRSEGTWKPCRVGDEQRNVMGLRFGFPMHVADNAVSKVSYGAAQNPRPV